MIIYHFPCADGFMAAAVAYRYYKGEVDLHPANHGEAPPDVTDREVYMLDFAYDREAMLDMADRSSSIWILDHHKTALKDLNGVWNESANLTCIFNNDKSGARLAWDFWYPGKDVPLIIRYVEDRDLWKFKVPDSAEAVEALRSYDYDFEVYIKLIDSDDLARALIKEGEILMRKRRKDVTEFIAMAEHKIKIGDRVVPALNCPYMWASDAGHQLARGNAFSVTYYIRGGQVVLGFRSTNDGDDVSHIAKSLGGGGHRNSAGCRMWLEDFVKLLQ